MVDIVMGVDTVDINCTMGADTVVDMEVTNPGTVADTEATDTAMADTGYTDTTRGMVMDLLMEAWEAMAVTEAPMENTIWRMKKRTKQQKIPKDTKSLNLTTRMLTTIFIKFMTMWMPETITKLTTFKSK